MDIATDRPDLNLYRAALEMAIAIAKASHHVARARGMTPKARNNLLSLLRDAIKSFPPGQFLDALERYDRKQLERIAYYEAKLKTYEELLDYRRLRIYLLEQERDNRHENPKTP